MTAVAEAEPSEREMYHDFVASGLSPNEAIDAVMRERAPRYSGSPHLGRKSCGWLGLVAPDLPGVPPDGRMVLFMLAAEEDYGGPLSTWDELAKGPLSPQRFERIIGQLVHAGALRVVGGQLSVEAPVDAGMVDIPANAD